MIRPTYLILGVLIATALTHGLGSLDRADRVRLLQFTRDLPTYLRVLEQAKRRDAEMDGWLAECHRRDAARQEVIAALLDRRMSLLEAAAQFRDLNAGSQQPTSRHLTNFRGASYEERICRQVIRWAHVALYWESPERAAQLAAELEEELETHLACGGACLPE